MLTTKNHGARHDFVTAIQLRSLTTVSINFVLIIARFKLLFPDWRGYLIALFALVWVANQYMSIYDRLRVGTKSERIEGEIKEEVIESAKQRKN